VGRVWRPAAVSFGTRGEQWMRSAAARASSGRDAKVSAGPVRSANRSQSRVDQRCRTQAAPWVGEQRAEGEISCDDLPQSSP
jgi:hypothetical protein